MKKLKIYYINDGLDGVVLAKSVKHAIRILSKYTEPYTKSEIMYGIKRNKNQWDKSTEWDLTNIVKVPKKGRYRKARMLGWCE
jgi:glutamine amidotransferase-like uncharacterized protein